MQVVAQMSGWLLLAGGATVTMAMTRHWCKRRRQIYSRELMQKLARAL